MTKSTDISAPQRPNQLLLALVGAAAGLLSGMFGIGGGTIIVPALVLWLGVSQKTATGTSVASILPASIVGASVYGAQGDVDWMATAALAMGIFAGAELGSVLLARIPVAGLQWSFMGFLLAVIVSLWFVVPQRDDVMTIGAVQFVLLVALGAATGILGGILGVGGGIIVVPLLMFFFGASDLVAKGSSLAMMIPGSLSGTIGNVRRGNMDLHAAIIIGLVACACVPLGALIARLVEPFWANVAFSVYLALILTQMLLKRLKPSRS